MSRFNQSAAGRGRTPRPSAEPGLQLFAPEAEEAVLVRPDLVQRDVAEAGLLPLPDLLEHGLGVRAARGFRHRLLLGQVLDRSVEVGRPWQLLALRAAECGVRPQLVHELPRLLLVLGPAELDLAV